MESYYHRNRDHYEKYRKKVKRFTLQFTLQDEEVRDWFYQHDDRGAYLKRLMMEDKARCMAQTQDKETALPSEADTTIGQGETPADKSEIVGGTPLTNQELNTRLYEKLFAEQADFKDWLLTQSPEEILGKAYEYTIREDIVLAMEYMDLTDEQAKALIASDKPLQEIFNAFENIEGNHMDTVRECIETKAKETIVAQAEALRNLPVYIFSSTFAKGHDELDEYRASFRANVECKNAIEEAIANHYKDNRLDGSCVQEVVDRFGAERVAFVLANTIQHKDWDGRISPENKEWAKPEPIPNDFGAYHNKKTLEYSCNQAHPGLINLFVNHFRKEQELEQEKKPSVLKKLKEAKVDTPSKAPTKKKEVEL